MHYWLSIQPTLLDEMVSLDGPGGHRLDVCDSCSNQQSGPIYRCIECSYSLLLCVECILKQHKALPLHRLEVCLFFQPSTLIWLTIHLVLAETEWILRPDLPPFPWARL